MKTLKIAAVHPLSTSLKLRRGRAITLIAASILFATVLAPRIAIAQVVSVQSPGFPIIDPSQSAFSAEYSINNSVLVGVEPFHDANEVHCLSHPACMGVDPNPYQRYGFISP